MRKLFTLCLAFLGVFTAWGQNPGKIAGQVKDEESKGISAATISLLKASDSSLVKLAVSDKAGVYEFVGVKPGKYLVSVTSVGFRKKFSKSFEYSGSDVNIETVALLRNAQDMSNVTVTAKKPFIETKLDRTIVNVDASPTSAGSTVMDIIEKSPGVMVNSDGVISLRGKQGVIIMIDGKQTYLNATDLAALLKNMSASQLDRIEIMTNPSAKYDASGNSGIIDIKTKKGLNNGFNGSVMIGATTSIYELDDKIYFMPKSQNSLNFNMKKNRFNFFGNYNPNYFRGRNTMVLNTKQIDPADGLVKGYTDQVTKFKFGNFNQTLKLGMDFYANKKNVFGIVASAFKFNGHPTPVTDALMRNEDLSFDARLITHTKNDFEFKNFTGNLNWKHTFDSTGRELTMDFDFVKYSNVGDMTMETDIYQANAPYTGHTELRGHLPAEYTIVTYRTDYTRPFKGGRFEAGLKTSFVRNDNLVNYDIWTGSEWISDRIRSNQFIYEENINAAYVNLNRQINKWSLQAGLRLENTNGKGNQVTTKTTFPRQFTNLFPTLFASYAVNKKNTVTLSMGRRIQRPNFQDMNPFIFFLDTLSFRQGNIHLRPQYTNNVELSHAFMGKFITTLSYNNTDDVISQIIKPQEGSGGKIRYLTPDNVANFENMALSITAPIPVAKWWSMNLFTTVYRNHYTGKYDTIDIDLAFTSFMANMINTFTIAKGFTAELSGFYRHKSIDQLTKVEPLYQMSIALQKQILKGKGTLRLNVRDPFAWQQFEGLNQYGYIDMRFRNKPDVRQVTATFTYRFGKQLQQQQRRRGSSQDEQNRVGGAGPQ